MILFIDDGKETYNPRSSYQAVIWEQGIKIELKPGFWQDTPRWDKPEQTYFDANLESLFADLRYGCFTKVTDDHNEREPLIRKYRPKKN